jgi:hypothetical protein
LVRVFVQHLDFTGLGDFTGLCYNTATTQQGKNKVHAPEAAVLDAPKPCVVPKVGGVAAGAAPKAGAADAPKVLLVAPKAGALVVESKPPLVMATAGQM